MEAKRRAGPDAATYRAELKEFIAQLPVDLQQKLKQAALSPDEIQELNAITRRRWREFPLMGAEWKDLVPFGKQYDPDHKSPQIKMSWGWREKGAKIDESTRAAEAIRDLLARAQARSTKR